MRRRLVEVCLRAYPRGVRDRDRDYLRDLALVVREHLEHGRQVAPRECVVRGRDDLDVASPMSLSLVRSRAVTEPTTGESAAATARRRRHGAMGRGMA
jgi:hypothetical protein